MGEKITPQFFKSLSGTKNVERLEGEKGEEEEEIMRRGGGIGEGRHIT